MYYIYVLFLNNKKFYKVYSEDLNRRIKKHNNGFVESTKDNRPVELAYYEAYHNKKDTMDREKYFKTG